MKQPLCQNVSVCFLYHQVQEQHVQEIQSFGVCFLSFSFSLFIFHCCFTLEIPHCSNPFKKQCFQALAQFPLELLHYLSLTTFPHSDHCKWLLSFFKILHPFLWGHADITVPEFTQLECGAEIAKIQPLLIHEKEQWECKKILLSCIQNWNINIY